MKTQLKREWTPEDFTRADKAIKKYFAGKRFRNHENKMVTLPRSKFGIEMFLGLPYTSTGIFACYALSCNVWLYYDEIWHYDYVVIDESGKVFILLSDAEENEKLIEI